MKAAIFILGCCTAVILPAAEDTIAIEPVKPVFHWEKDPENVPKERILMIGDTPETDIRGAHGVGIHAALVTQTGVMAKSFETQGEESTIRQLSERDKPDFLLGRLRLRGR